MTGSGYTPASANKFPVLRNGKARGYRLSHPKPGSQLAQRAQQPSAQ